MNEQPTDPPDEDDVEGHSIRGERGDYAAVDGERLTRRNSGPPRKTADDDDDVEGHAIGGRHPDPR